MKIVLPRMMAVDADFSAEVGKCVEDAFLRYEVLY